MTILDGVTHQIRSPFFPVVALLSINHAQAPIRPYSLSVSGAPLCLMRVNQMPVG